MTRGYLALALVALAGCVPMGEVQRLDADTGATAPLPVWSPGAPNPLPPARSNADMTRDFLELGFAMESGRPIDAFSRFEGPVAVVAVNPPSQQAITDLDRLIARFRTEAGIDIHRTATPSEGENRITVDFVPRRQMQAMVPSASCFVVPNVDGWQDFVANRRSTAIDWTRVVQRTRAAVFIPADTTPQEIRDCLHEEIAQGLGPLNDLFRLSDSIFNDDNFQTTLTGFDMLLLRVWYSPELHPGMTRDQVAARLPTLYNRLNPHGRGRGGAQVGITPRAWQQAIEQALSSADGLGARRESAARALALARSEGWTDNRLALSLMLVARVAPRDQGEEAMQALLQAAGEAGRFVKSALRN